MVKLIVNLEDEAWEEDGTNMTHARFSFLERGFKRSVWATWQGDQAGDALKT